MCANTGRFDPGFKLHFLKRFVAFFNDSFIGGGRNIYNNYIFTISDKLLACRLKYSQWRNVIHKTVEK
jgi:hypothetical protein